MTGVDRSILNEYFGWVDDVTSHDEVVNDLAELIVRIMPSVYLREMKKRCPHCRGRNPEQAGCEVCGGTGMA